MFLRATGLTETYFWQLLFYRSFCVAEQSYGVLWNYTEGFSKRNENSTNHISFIVVDTNFGVYDRSF
jgi:hypothetical protein